MGLQVFAVIRGKFLDTSALTDFGDKYSAADVSIIQALMNFRIIFENQGELHPGELQVEDQFWVNLRTIII